jgi:hypothetical protein
MQLYKKIALIIALAAYAANAQVTSVVTIPGITATGVTVTIPAQVSTVVGPSPPPAATGTEAAGTTTTGAAPPPAGTGSSSRASVSTGYVQFRISY